MRPGRQVRSGRICLAHPPRQTRTHNWEVRFRNRLLILTKCFFVAITECSIPMVFLGSGPGIPTAVQAYDADTGAVRFSLKSVRNEIHGWRQRRVGRFKSRLDSRYRRWPCVCGGPRIRTFDRSEIAVIARRGSPPRAWGSQATIAMGHGMIGGGEDPERVRTSHCRQWRPATACSDGFDTEWGRFETVAR